MHPALAYVFKIVAGAAVSIALIAAAQAQQAEPKKHRSRPETQTQSQPLKRTARPQSTSCSEFGAGFVRMPGSDSCIRFGGGVGIGVGAVP